MMDLIDSHCARINAANDDLKAKLAAMCERAHGDIDALHEKMRRVIDDVSEETAAVTGSLVEAVTASEVALNTAMLHRIRQFQGKSGMDDPPPAREMIASSSSSSLDLPEPSSFESIARAEFPNCAVTGTTLVISDDDVNEQGYPRGGSLAFAMAERVITSSGRVLKSRIAS